jgi:hypothetical protein
MASNIFNTYMKSHYKSDYFGTGGTQAAKRRLRRALKKSAKNEFDRDIDHDPGN